MRFAMLTSERLTRFGADSLRRRAYGSLAGAPSVMHVQSPVSAHSQPKSLASGRTVLRVRASSSSLVARERGGAGITCALNVSSIGSSGGGGRIASRAQERETEATAPRRPRRIDGRADILGLLPDLRAGRRAGF